ncbi:hypothetical protein [Halomonas sp.]|uniref:hypothetical protein n=1 Tax=Halomonas sp. TaxID=1486246 RepID=UPI002579F6BF|nr:hypothetical protein [Halomonas sp.]|tara:strand:- start:482 stop:2725 length:2244 start_codon:yes stop_codon:yes gene_type:complete
MTKYATGNPVLPNGSDDPRDLLDNAQNLDVLAVSREKTEHPDRLGVPRKTWYGMEQEFQQFLVNSGYTGTGPGGAYEDYDADGPLTIDALNEIFTKDGEFYRLKPGQAMPYTTTTWATDEVNVVAMGDAALRQELAEPGGFILVRGACGYVESIYDLQDLTLPATHTQVIVSAYHPSKGFGGGMFKWDTNKEKSKHDGANVISPTVPSIDNQTGSIEQRTLAFLQGEGETDLNGHGCFVRLTTQRATAIESGLFGDGRDESELIQQFIYSCRGKEAIFDEGFVFCGAGIELNDQEYDKTKVIFKGKFKLRKRTNGSESTRAGAFIGILFRGCSHNTLVMNGDGNRLEQPESESAFLCAIAGCTNFRSPYFFAREVRGDGLYITQYDFNTESAIPTDLSFGVFHVENDDDDGRNAMSIISAKNLTVDIFRSIRVGSVVSIIQPGGFDIEPNHPHQAVENIYVGDAYIDTAGNFGLQIYGSNSSVLGGNVTNVTFSNYMVNSRYTGVCTPVSFQNCRGVRFNGSCSLLSSATNAAALNIDNAVDIYGQNSSRGGSLGARLGAEHRVVSADVKVIASSYEVAALQSVYLTRSKVEIFARDGALGSYALYTRKLYRPSVQQDNVHYLVDAPGTGTLGTRGHYNEPPDPMSFSECTIKHGDLTGYTDLNSASNAGPGLKKVDIPGVSYQDSQPSTGSWNVGDIVHRKTPSIDANNMIAIGWIRLTSGSGNTDATDWTPLRVSTVSPVTTPST